jgi:hypothetical protein
VGRKADNDRRLNRIAQWVPVARRSGDRAGSWDVTGLRGAGSNDWTVEDVFLPERRTMPQLGIPLENQWARCQSSVGSGRITAP